jgi:hypothetical protein
LADGAIVNQSAKKMGGWLNEDLKLVLAIAGLAPALSLRELGQLERTTLPKRSSATGLWQSWLGIESLSLRQIN